jgi:hypothetical protein
LGFRPFSCDVPPPPLPSPHSHSPRVPKTRSISQSAEVRSKNCPACVLSSTRIPTLTILTCRNARPMLLSGKADLRTVIVRTHKNHYSCWGHILHFQSFFFLHLLGCLPSRPLTLLIRDWGAFVLRGGLCVLCRRLGVRGCSGAGIDRRLHQSLAPRVWQVRRTRSCLLQLWKKEEGFREAW